MLDVNWFSPSNVIVAVVPSLIDIAAPLAALIVKSFNLTLASPSIEIQSVLVPLIVNSPLCITNFPELYS